MMDTIRIDLSRSAGGIKPLNATNGGPIHKRHAADQYRSNFDAYRAARIPYSRNHDSAFCDVYGGPYSHDITAIFPVFDADPFDPASYDFACTDESILTCLDAGTKTFFRLGQSIEHQIKKHGTLPPKDFHKWAVICEHIIRHYNEGWADGFRLGMEYWEIWNEPDLDDDDSPDKRTWGGTRAQFFDFYAEAAQHLKACFPGLKIGGPALAYREDWADAFLAEMRSRGVPIDFFSWHIYTTDPCAVSEKGARIRAMLDRHGYTQAESILNEWNYIRGWTTDYVYSLEAIHGMKGAAFLAACMAQAQASSIDMLMYYDTRLSAFNGAFDFYSLRPLKGYTPLAWFGRFYDMDHTVPVQTQVPDIYPLCAVDTDGKIMCMVTYYTENDAAPTRTITLECGRDVTFDVYWLDEAHDGCLFPAGDGMPLVLKPQTVLLFVEHI